MHLPPRPTAQPILALKRGPGCLEWNELHGWRKPGEQGRGVGAGKERDVGVFGGLAQERHRQRKIAEAPQFEGQQAGAGVAGWFCQARGVKF